MTNTNKGGIKVKKTNIKITRYKHEDYWVDIVDTGEMYEAWIQHKRYGISDLMFGVWKNDTKTEEEMVELIIPNLQEHINYYNDEYVK